ncbi:hypothetical protein FDP41_003053 [Naegleria fowleri]|uniref:Uncharacterized protein n=1 Tax=Naegleria fowleri TaxID=5763 RepID=A0A6A5BTQ5_NAEFO|nr:uncharacterized protein FDP41_003053 [Naegleria fowleri]KAF0977731.1 hypothetical protein FDP41_003053 [Naegleria fowleri]
MKRIVSSSVVCKCVALANAPRGRSSASAAIAMMNSTTTTTSSTTTSSHRLFHHQSRAMEEVKQSANIDFSNKSVSDFINELNAMKVEPMEKRTADKTREQLYYLYSVENHIQKEIETFQQQIDGILNESTTQASFNEDALVSLKSRFSLLLKWVLAIQQLTLDNGLYRLVQPLLIGEKADKFLQVLLEEPHVGKSHFPIYYSLTVLKAKVRASIALGDYETARVACEQLLTKISQVRTFYAKRRQEVEKEEREAETIGITVEQYRKNQRQLKAKDSVEEVVNKIYELQQEQDITFPSSQKAPDFDIYFGIEPITANIESQLERMEVETQITNVQVLFYIAMKNEGSANSILAWLDSKLRDAKLLGTFSNVIFKVSKASILAIQGDQKEEAIKIFAEALQQMTKSYADISKDLQQLSTVALNLLLYSTKKRNPAVDIHAYMKMTKADNTETSPQVKDFVRLVLIDLFTSRGQLEAALNYISQAKEIHFNNGYFSPVYASLLRREAEVLILSEQAAPNEIISLLENAIDLRVEQYGPNDRYLPIFYDLLVYYCQQNKLDHEKLTEFSSKLSKVNIPVLKREEIFWMKVDLAERNI